ncbi:MAG: FG-GAP repeat domain-containing protein, partial [Candidatus Korobacteraceae bacterium]
YRTVRNPKAPGGAEFVPHLIHNRSGMGSHVALVDLNKDGMLDIITATRRGTFIFWNQWKKTSSQAAR